MPLIRPQHSPVSKPIRISYDGHCHTPFVAVSPGKFDADCIAVHRNHPPVSSWWAPADLKSDPIPIFVPGKSDHCGIYRAEDEQPYRVGEAIPVQLVDDE